MKSFFTNDLKLEKQIFIVLATDPFKAISTLGFNLIDPYSYSPNAEGIALNHQIITQGKGSINAMLITTHSIDHRIEET
ncbi:MAG: hypothetical protein QXI22_01910 [Sulfolobales archaeon]